jgi:hypothetical protein
MVGTVHSFSAADFRRTRLTWVAGALAVALIVATLALGSATVAQATPVQDVTSIDTPTPPPTATEGLGSAVPLQPNDGQTTPAPAVRPTIQTPVAGSFIGSGRATISGTKAPDDHVQLFASGTGDEPICIIDADGSARWSCPDQPLPNGEDIALRVVVTGDASLSAETTVSVLGPPAIDADSGSILSNGLLHGTAYPGARVTARVSGPHAQTAGCTFTADSSGRWACILSADLGDGRYAVSASQVGPAPFGSEESDASASVPMLLDRQSPAAPNLTTPRAGAHFAAGARLNFAGTGEDGARVTVWAGVATGSQQICSSAVTDGAWSCMATAGPPGHYVVSALQQDAAGNTGPASATISLVFDAASGSPRSEAPPDTAQPNAPVDPDQTPPTPGTPSPYQAGPPAAGPSGPSGGGIPPTPLATTPFTSAIHSVSDVGALTNWLRAALLAIIAMVLLAIPARMLAGTVAVARAGTPGRGLRLFGRNRASAEYDEAPDLARPAPWLLTGCGLIVAAVLVALSGPVESQSAYFRLIPAIVLALGLVGTVAVGVPLLTCRRHPDVTTRFGFAPYALALVAGATVVSRLLELQPALLYGVIVTVSVTGGSAIARGKVAAVQVGALAALASVGWIAVGLLPVATTTVTAFVSEFANAVVLLAIGSAGVLLLPLGSLPGRAILQWSRGMWLGITVAVDTVLFAILVPTQRLHAHGAGAVTFAVCILGFATVSVSVWLWQRYVAPTLR